MGPTHIDTKNGVVKYSVKTSTAEINAADQVEFGESHPITLIIELDLLQLECVCHTYAVGRV